MQPHLDLLPPGKRPANEGPGDTAEMARLRLALERRVDAGASTGEGEALQRFLDIVQRDLKPGAVVLDLGCGTGYLLRRLGLMVPGPLALLGLDISRAMLDGAYRTLRAERRAVVARASTRRALPVRDAVVDVVVRRLAPMLEGEAMRVLKAGGVYVTSSFGSSRWRELYDALPDLPRPHQRREDATESLRRQGFASAEHHAWVGTEMVAIDEALQRLKMGPAAFHIDEGRDTRRLHDLAAQQGSGAYLRLTTHVEVSVGVKA